MPQRLVTGLFSLMPFNTHCFEDGRQPFLQLRIDAGRRSHPVSHHHRSPGPQDAPGFAEKPAPISGAAQDLHEHHNIKSAVTKRQLSSVRLRQARYAGGQQKLLQHSQRRVDAK
jgi:hypothetical protein